MIFIFLLFIILFVIGIKFTGKETNHEYLSKDTTTIINGLFVIMVFFSHFKNYLVMPNIYDNYLSNILEFIGQLMVTSFLFYSGYGIYESIKNKKDYMKSFFKKRFLPTYLNFFIAIILFIIVNVILGNELSIKTVLLSFTGYESIGNSNWYMLAIFSLYLFVMICVRKNNKLSNILLFSVLCFLYVFVLKRLKSGYYVNTILCFPMGVFYSYYKDKIEKIVFKNYFAFLIISLSLLVLSYFIKDYNVYTYSIYAIVFILFIVLLSMKIKLHNKVYLFFGKYTFWIYILQRIPMMLLQGKFNNYVYFGLVFISTMVLSIILKRLTDKIYKKILY